MYTAATVKCCPAHSSGICSSRPCAGPCVGADASPRTCNALLASRLLRITMATPALVRPSPGSPTHQKDCQPRMCRRRCTAVLICKGYMCIYGCNNVKAQLLPLTAELRHLSCKAIDIVQPNPKGRASVHLTGRGRAGATRLHHCCWLVHCRAGRALPALGD